MNSITDFSPRAVIVDAGDFPSHPIPLRWLTECRFTVCCDGAADRYLALYGQPWRIVGDCDSVSEKVRISCESIIRRFPDQETNDQTKAVKYLQAKRPGPITIVAATGLREDHTLGNISLLAEYHRQGIEARIYTDHGVFIATSGDTTFHVPEGTQVSVFNFGATGMHGEGLRYQFRDFDSWWQGTLNETTAPEFTIRAQGTYLVFINYPPGCR
ncbi:MAG: thiamine diphosphokinase [Duncaniella sp.]|nr:thiamine diphosphokinase [Duncaniella sp.]